VATALHPVESHEQKAWRCAKYKALRMDLLTTDREETELRVHTRTHTRRNMATGKRKEFNLRRSFHRIKGCL